MVLSIRCRVCDLILKPHLFSSEEASEVLLTKWPQGMQYFTIQGLSHNQEHSYSIIDLRRL